MNLESRHYINGIEIRPKDADEIGLKLDWTGDAEEAELNVDSLVLENLGKKLVIDHINQFGVFEGLPYTFQIGTFTLEYYIDLTENPKISGRGDSGVEVTIKRRKAVDWFLQQANGLSFESLNKTNPLATIDVPYLIVKDNQLELLIMLGISVFTLTKALIEGIQALAVSIAEFLETIAVGTVFLLGAFLSKALKLIAAIIYVTALLIALIDLTKQIIELIFPPIRKFKACTVLELMQKGCQKFGYTFSSSIIESQPQLTILGVPLKKDNEDIIMKLFTLSTGYYNKGYPTARDTVSTLGILIKSLQQMFNAKVRIVNNEVIFERRDYWVLNSGVSITRTLNLQDKRENQWGYNIGDAWKRYYIHYRYDVTDFHTMNHLESTDCEYSTEPVTIQNADLVSIKGLVDISIPFAFAIRKVGLTYVEEACLPFAKLADEVIQFFGGDSSLEAKIKGRVGVMLIGQQYFSVTKLLFQTGGKQGVNYLSNIGANSLYQNYHTINQVKENFKKVYTETIAFSTQQFMMLLENNYVTDQNGSSLEILTFDWVNEGKTAEITYAVLSGEGFNTKTILIDGE